MSSILNRIWYLDFVMLLCNSSTYISLRLWPMLRVCNATTIQDCFLNQLNKNNKTWFQAELYYLQASGPPLQPLVLGHVPVISFPSLPLTTTRQCSLEESNKDMDTLAEITESMTVFLWILSQWYAQRD